MVFILFEIGIENWICGMLISYDANFKNRNWNRESFRWSSYHLDEFLGIEIGIEFYLDGQIINLWN